MYYYAGEGSSVTIDFLENGDFIVPDFGSVTYSIRDNEGVLVAGHIDVSVVTDATTTRITLNIDPTVNTTTKEIEKRSVIVDFLYNGDFKRIVYHYQLVDWINLTITAKDVRNYLGVAAVELPDDEVDIPRAYYETKAVLAVGDLDALLVAGTRQTYFANSAIVYRAALNALPSLQLRVNQSEQTDTLKFARLAKIDLVRLQYETSRLYAQAIEILDGTSGDVAPLLLTLSVPTDVITDV